MKKLYMIFLFIIFTQFIFCYDGVYYSYETDEFSVISKTLTFKENKVFLEAKLEDRIIKYEGVLNGKIITFFKSYQNRKIVKINFKSKIFKVEENKLVYIDLETYESLVFIKK